MKLFLYSCAGVFGLCGMLVPLIVGQMRDEGPSELGWILFDSNVNGPAEIFRMTMDGKIVEQLTFNEFEDQMPRWSPDGEWIAFMSQRDGNEEIYRMRPNGTDVLRLTHNDHGDWEPRWSPDSKWIIFMSTPNSGGGDLVRVRPDGSDMQTITDTQWMDWPPTFSADGQWMMFTTNAEGISGSMLMRARPDGSETHEVAFRRNGGLFPDWSPTTGAYVYRSGQALNTETGELFINSLEEDSPLRLTSNQANDFGASWSPDGEWIHFISDRDDNWELYRMRPDGTEVQRLTENNAQDYWMTWSPRGDWILFISGRDETLELYRMRPDGSQQERLTYLEGREVNHSWSPPIEYEWQPDLLMVGNLFVGISMAGWLIVRGKSPITGDSRSSVARFYLKTIDRK